MNQATVALLFVFGLGAAACGGAAAQGDVNWPTKPIRAILPVAPGTGADVVFRLVFHELSSRLGQQIVIENRGGAGGTIGADAVAKSAPDGYTLLMHNITFPLASTAMALAGRLPYNLDTDFAGVSIVVNVPLVMTAATSVPAKDLKELAALLKGNPNLKYTYGSTGPGSFMNVIGEAFKKEAGVDMTHVPFKGAAPMKQELLVGRIDVGGDQVSSSLAEIKSGKLKALATHGARRIADLPDVPTVRELGYPILELEGWNGLLVAAKTPKEIIDRLNKEAVAAAKHPDSVKRFADLAAESVGSSPAEQDAIVRRQAAQFRPIIQTIKLE
jgi:tripartite-type tricarboxylate transporter receptor subunit TctC